jgi:hypothetical protein
VSPTNFLEAGPPRRTHHRLGGEGLYVTELIGFGVNTVTGDYSRGRPGSDRERRAHLPSRRSRSRTCGRCSRTSS